MAIGESSFERSLALLREQGLRAIDLKSFDSYRRTLLKHADLIDDYVKAKLKFRVALQRQRVTLPAFLGHESTVVYKICASLEELVRKAFQFQNLEAASTTAQGLAEALANALDGNALNVFERVLDLFKLGFALAIRLEDSAKRMGVIERLSATIENFGSYRLVWAHFEKSDKAFEPLARYGQALIMTFAGVLKDAVDRRDVRAFSVLLGSLGSTMAEGPQDRASELLTINLRLRVPGLSETARVELGQKAGQLRVQIEFFRTLQRTKRTLLIGLGGWAVRRYKEKQLEADQLQAMVSSIFPYLGGFAELTELYLRQFLSDPDPYGWGLWQAEPQVATEGGLIDRTAGGLIEFYVITAIRALSEPIQEEEALYSVIVEQSIPSSSLEMAAKEIAEVGASIATNPGTWRALLPELEGVMVSPSEAAIPSEKFGLLDAFWANLVSRRRADEEQGLLDATLAHDTLALFSEEFKKSWSENSIFRGLAKAYSFYEDHTSDVNVPATVVQWGINRLEQKQWFVQQGAFAVRSIAENLGRGLAESETRQALEAITPTLTTVHATTSNQAKRILDAFIDWIDHEDIHSYILISVFGFDFEAALYKSDQFENIGSAEGGQLAPFKYRARYRRIPVVPVWIPGAEKRPAAICVPIRRLGVWRQYWSGAVGQELKINIDSIDEAAAETLLEANARFGIDESGQPYDHMEAVRRLRKTVHVQIWERFLYVVTTGHLAIRIEVQRIE